MSLKPVFSTTLFALAERAAGVFPSGPVSAPGHANNLIVCTFVSAVSGTTKTLDIAVQTSPDGATWTTIVSGAQITAIGQQMITAFVGGGLYAQVLATVGGSGVPLMTFQLTAVVI